LYEENPDKGEWNCDLSRIAFKTKGKGKLQNRLQGMREKTHCLFKMHTITL